MNEGYKIWVNSLNHLGWISYSDMPVFMTTLNEPNAKVFGTVDMEYVTDILGKLGYDCCVFVKKTPDNR